MFYFFDVVIDQERSAKQNDRSIISYHFVLLNAVNIDFKISIGDQVIYLYTDLIYEML